MKVINASTAATLVGSLLGVGIAVQPVLNSVQGSMHARDWVNLVLAGIVAFFGKRVTF